MKFMSHRSLPRPATIAGIALLACLAAGNADAAEPRPPVARRIEEARGSADRPGPQVAERPDDEPIAVEVEAERPDVGQAVEFLRLKRDAEDNALSLDTAIVRYRETLESAVQSGRRKRLEVDLVGAVHLGGRGYYDELDRRFKAYDAVLYELVAPDNARVPKPGHKASGAIGSAQQGMTKMLGLEFQLEQIDYRAPNFVHADLSPREFDAAMAKRGESWWTMFVKLMQESVDRAERGESTGPALGFRDMIGLLFGLDREVRLRRIMAEQFTDMDLLTEAFGGEEGSSLITDRNSAAIEVLREEIRKGRSRIAIFYGAAHMADFDRRLRKEFHLEPRETIWLEAWDLRSPRPAKGK